MKIGIKKSIKKKILLGRGEGHSPTIEKLLKKYGANKNSSILEIGCGEGFDNSMVAVVERK